MFMAEYDKFAEIYDVWIAKDVGDDKFYLDLAKKTKGPVLEIACGTGRIYLPMLQNGVDAYGIDISSKMLSILKEKAAAANLEPKVFKADMRNFRLKKKFALIIVPYRAFLHLLDTESQLAALKTIRSHLAPGGKFAINFFFPSSEAIKKTYGKWKKETNRGIAQKSFSDFSDEVNQIITSESVLTYKGKKYHTKISLALIYKKEFELLLRLAGFSKWKVYGGFNYKKLKGVNEMVWIIEK